VREKDDAMKDEETDTLNVAQSKVELIVRLRSAEKLAAKKPSQERGKKEVPQ